MMRTKTMEPALAPKRGRGRPLSTIDESTLAGRIGARIRVGRLAAGLTIEALAERLDTHEQTLRHWEHGDRCLPIGMAMPVCAALGLELAELVRVQD